MCPPPAERVPPNKSAHNGAIKAAGATESAIDPTTLEKTRSNTTTPQELLDNMQRSDKKYPNRLLNKLGYSAVLQSINVNTGAK